MSVCLSGTDTRVPCGMGNLTRVAHHDLGNLKCHYTKDEMKRSLFFKNVPTHMVAGGLEPGGPVATEGTGGKKAISLCPRLSHLI